MSAGHGAGREGCDEAADQYFTLLLCSAAHVMLSPSKRPSCAYSYSLTLTTLASNPTLTLIPTLIPILFYLFFSYSQYSCFSFSHSYSCSSTLTKPLTFSPLISASAVTLLALPLLLLFLLLLFLLILLSHLESYFYSFFYYYIYF